MKRPEIILLTPFVIILAAILGCRNFTGSGSQPSSTSNGPSSSSTSSSSQGLTNSKVETAVNSLLSDWRLGGSVSVRGIQEVPQQNSAVADLQFNSFEYGTTFEGSLLKSKDFKPRKPSGDAIPHPDEMFPQRKVSSENKPPKNGK